MVLIRDHHPGYISWEQFERNQAMLAENAHMKSRMEPKAGRGGRSLLAGLLRCRRCGQDAARSLQRHARRGAPLSLPRGADQSRSGLVHLVRRIETGSRRSQQRSSRQWKATPSRQHWKSRHVLPNNKANGIARCHWNWSKRVMKRALQLDDMKPSIRITVWSRGTGGALECRSRHRRRGGTAIARQRTAGQCRPDSR